MRTNKIDTHINVSIFCLKKLMKIKDISLEPNANT